MVTNIHIALYFQHLSAVAAWNVSCTVHDMLRITVLTSEKKVVLKLEGRLAGPWVDELRRTVVAGAWCQPLELEVSSLTFVDEDGEQALSWLHRMGARFRGEGPLPHYLFERLKIPLSSPQPEFHERNGQVSR